MALANLESAAEHEGGPERMPGQSLGNEKSCMATGVVRELYRAM